MNDSQQPGGDGRLVARRTMLHALGAALAAVPLSQLVGCSSEPATSADGSTDATTANDTTASTDTGAATDAPTLDASDARTADAADASSGRWATGGTAAMVAAAMYPNPFTQPGGTSCMIHCQTTIGPCHTTSPMRTDVSDGNDGLPVRLSLRILDESCNPVQNAIVEIWHTNYRGVYSGNINTMCNREQVDRAAMYFRGYLRTDASGRVDFNTCFPGWYSSRAVHIHVRIMTGDYNAADNAQASVITQLFFPASLVAEVFGGEALYSTFGQPDTSLMTDNVIGGTTDQTPYLCDIARMPDGAMQASKTIIIRSASSTTQLCNTQGAGGMMGGPMGDGGMPPPRD